MITKVLKATNSLSKTLKRFASKRRLRIQNKRRRAKDSDYRKSSKIKNYDVFRNADTVFPVNLKIKTRYFYTPKRGTVTKNINMDGNLEFHYLTGNEILLAMMDVENFNNDEVSNSLKALANLNRTKNFDWNNHEIIMNVVDAIYYRMQTLSAVHYVAILKNLKILGIEDEELWERFSELFNKMHPKLKADDFGVVFNQLMSQEQVDEEIKQEMTLLLPRELKHMSPSVIVEAFKHVVEHEFLTEYIWHYHFHLQMWGKASEFTIEDFHRSIKTLVEIDYFDYKEWWNNEFLPNIAENIQLCTNSNDCQELITVLVEVNNLHKDIEVASYVKKLEERMSFVDHKLPLIQGATFAEVVKKDLRYYEEQEKLNRELLSED